MEHAQSLDPADTEPEWFYFTVRNGSEDVMYRLEKEQVTRFIPTFIRLVVEANPCTEASALSIHTVKVEHTLPYYIGTNAQYQLVVDYISHWKSKDNENYIAADSAQLGFVYQLLKKYDLDLLNKYIDQHIIKNANDSDTIIKYKTMQVLSPLLKFVDGFLQMEGLSNKIYTYIAAIIRNSDITDLTDEQFLTLIKKDCPDLYRQLVEDQTLSDSE